MQKILPNGVTQENFDAAIAEYKKVIGDENVLTEPEQLGWYSEKLPPEPASKHQPAGALRPQSVEEIQQIVGIANKYKTPLWTFSTGGNCGYGSAAPATAGQIVLDLRRMNKIHYVDDRTCTALVDAGVTYPQLIEYVKEHNLDIWVSFPASLSLGSPTGNTLDRGVGFNRNGEHVANFSGLEVVLANGEVLRTGLGGVGDGQAWQSYRWGFGPWVDGLFSQSNFGIVTKMGLWLMKKPPASQYFTVGWADDETFAAGVEVAAALKRDGVLEGGVNAGDSYYAIAQTIKKTDLWQGKDAIPLDIIADYKKQLQSPAMSLATVVYGDEAEIASKIARAKKELEATGGIFMMGPEIEAIPAAAHGVRQGTGVPDDDELGLMNYKPGRGEAWFAPVVPTRKEDILTSLTLARTIFRKHGFEYIGGFVVNPRAGEHVVMISYDTSDPDEIRRAYECFEEAVKEHAKLGFGLYRTNTAFMKLAAETYGPAQTAFNKTLKAALDPNGILSPGKSGIYL